MVDTATAVDRGDQSPPAAVADSGDAGGDSLADLAKPDKGLLDDLTRSQRTKIAEEQRVMDTTLGRADEDRAIMKRAFDREGVAMDDIKPWDVKTERAKYKSDPIADFGSFASIFAIAASAFTKTPMTNALNASAAAMNAVREGNDREYERAYQAWKDNNQLAIKRGEMMHQQYADAMSLLNTDYKRGDIEMQQAARRFGDTQVLTLLEHGYSEQAFDLISKRSAALKGLVEADAALTTEKIKKQVFDTEMKAIEKEPNPIKRAGYQLDAINRIYGGKSMTNPAMQVMGQIMAEHGPGTREPWTAEQFVDYAEKHGLLPYSRSRFSGANQKAQMIEDETQHNIDLGMEPLAAREDAIRKVTALSAVRTPGRDQMELIAEKAVEIKNLHPEMSDVQARIEAQKFIKLATAVPTGNRVDQLQARSDQIKYADGIIDNVESLLKKHNAITGLGGKISRPTEVLTNILGSGSTDYKQFESFVTELQLLMPRILTDSQGRPLGVEAGHINTIVRGLNVGDTVANTTRAMQELKKQLSVMRQDTQKRMRADISGDPASAPSAAPATSDEPLWKSAPLVEGQ